MAYAPAMMSPGMAQRAAIRMQLDGASLMPGEGLRPGDNSADPGAGNFRRLSDKLKEADLEPLCLAVR